MTTVNDKTETEVLLGDGRILHLPGSDVDVVLQELRTRQFFKFLKILTVGAGGVLADLKIGPDTDPEELTQSIVALLIVSIPEAEDEVVDFLRSMVAPVGLIEPEKSKADRTANVELYQKLYENLENPKVEDSLEILIKTVENEAPNLIELGKRVAATLPTVLKLSGSSKKPSKKSTRKDSSADS